MQARLQPSEYAYLLNVLGAVKVVGINNDYFFPDETAVRQALMSKGFTLLKDHGWFREENGQISANNTLFLMTAVSAAPQTVVTATYIDSQSNPHTVTFYQAEGYTVEQFQTDGGELLLTMLDSPEEITDHLVQALGLPDRPNAHSLTLPLREFKEALAAARDGRETPLLDLITGESELGHMAQPLARAIATLRPAGRIEGAAVKGVDLGDWGEIGLLRDQTEQLWLAVQNEAADTIVLSQGAKEPFRSHLTRLLDSLWAAAPV